MLIGLGFPTLIAVAGKPLIVVGDVLNVRLVGPLLLQAGKQATPTLLRWGNSTHFPGDSVKPGIMYDIFARVGGPDLYETQAASMVQIFSGNVIGDNLWLWRADHTVSGLVTDGKNPCNHGLQVK